jgi:hypothetical protein
MSDNGLSYIASAIKLLARAIVLSALVHKGLYGYKADALGDLER